MHKRRVFYFGFLFLILAAVLLTFTFRSMARSTKPGPPIAIPFELINRHIVLHASVDGSKPLLFVFDTGDKYAIIDHDRASALGLRFVGALPVKGTGAVTSGSLILGSSYSIVGLPDFSQPLRIAIPLKNMAPRLGCDFDGIIGADFISQFVVEVDYDARVIRLHDKDRFHYKGSGESIQIHLDQSGHPIFDGAITPAGHPAIHGQLELDLGAGHAVMIKSPIVRRFQLPGPNVKTARQLSAGAGGDAKPARIGRIESVTIGKFTVLRPYATFSADAQGTDASTETLGSIGQELASRFRIFLDYSHDRIILEPTRRLDAPFERAFSGMALEAIGNNYKTFRVLDVDPDSPAATAGIRSGDVISAIDQRPATEWTLTRLLEALEQPIAHPMKITRGGETLNVSVVPREL